MWIKLQKTYNMREYLYIYDLNKILQNRRWVQEGEHTESGITSLKSKEEARYHHCHRGRFSAESLQEMPTELTWECWLRVCYFCSQYGHVNRFCLNGRQRQLVGPHGGGYFQCGLLGHQFKDSKMELIGPRLGALQFLPPLPKRPATGPRLFILEDHEGT